MKKSGKWPLIFSISLGTSIFLFLFILRAAKPIEVSSINPKEMDYYEKVVATGRVVPTNMLEIRSQVAGTILESPLNQGDVINKDALLLIIDSQDISLQIKEKQLVETYNKRKTLFDHSL
ncbi:hypothetical protein SAMN05660297_01508 [Natronincola peptidivorans]|uniref:Biotin-lipoyl like n=1 Tax=Natronincola peptidivorans TaxID=426128 RepID=A0A1I0C7W8_9FIRM|nr:efflux RND transporter periplasmic adaptor subunit [Natronincola peptidivorans]SET15178.1 hypothetical protein SAMN05660297_01508 [Natronincola peptidivorans]